MYCGQTHPRRQGCQDENKCVLWQNSPPTTGMPRGEQVCTVAKLTPDDRDAKRRTSVYCGQTHPRRPGCQEENKCVLWPNSPPTTGMPRGEQVCTVAKLTPDDRDAKRRTSVYCGQTHPRRQGCQEENKCVLWPNSPPTAGMPRGEQVCTVAKLTPDDRDAKRRTSVYCGQTHPRRQGCQEENKCVLWPNSPPTTGMPRGEQVCTVAKLTPDDRDAKRRTSVYCGQTHPRRQGCQEENKCVMWPNSPPTTGMPRGEQVCTVAKLTPDDRDAKRRTSVYCGQTHPRRQGCQEENKCVLWPNSPPTTGMPRGEQVCTVAKLTPDDRDAKRRTSVYCGQTHPRRQGCQEENKCVLWPNSPPTTGMPRGEQVCTVAKLTPDDRDAKRRTSVYCGQTHPRRPGCQEENKCVLWPNSPPTTGMPRGEQVCTVAKLTPDDRDAKRRTSVYCGQTHPRRQGCQEENKCVLTNTGV